MAHRPDGDAMQFDLLNECQPGAAPRAGSSWTAGLGHRRGGERRAGRPAQPDRDRRYARRERIPVWDVVEGTIRANATYPPSFYALLVIAGLIAAVGILTNSQILVVGAMVVGPEYFAIIAAALGCSKRDWAAGPGGARRAVPGLPGRDHRDVPVRAGGPGSGVAPAAVPARGPAGGRADQLPERVLRHRGGPGRHGRRGLAHRIPGQRADRRVHLGHDHPGGRVDRSVRRLQSWHDAAGSVDQLLLNVVILIAVGAAGLSAQRALGTGWPGGRGRYRMAMGLTGEPVPPGSRSGAMTHRNDQRPACSHAGTRSSNCR